MVRVVCLAGSVGLALSLGACVGDRPSLAEASGPLRPMNTRHWHPTAEDLRGPHEALLPADTPALSASETHS